MPEFICMATHPGHAAGPQHKGKQCTRTDSASHYEHTMGSRLVDAETWYDARLEEEAQRAAASGPGIKAKGKSLRLKRRALREAVPLPVDELWTMDQWRGHARSVFKTYLSEHAGGFYTAVHIWPLVRDPVVVAGAEHRRGLDQIVRSALRSGWIKKIDSGFLGDVYRTADGTPFEENKICPIYQRTTEFMETS